MTSLGLIELNKTIIKNDLSQKKLDDIAEEKGKEGTSQFTSESI